MRKLLALGLLVVVSWLGGAARDAQAGVTIDVVFQDATSPSGITINAGDPGPGCTFSGYYGTTVSTGYCMDVIVATTWRFTEMSVSVQYDTEHGLALATMREWIGLGQQGTPPKACASRWLGEPVDNGGILQSFGCIIPPPVAPPSAAPGTYRIGTIIWDTSATTPGTAAIAAVIAAGDGMTAVINGNAVDVSSSIVLGSHILTIIPEPGTAALLGLGLAGLIVSARRRRR